MHGMTYSLTPCFFWKDCDDGSLITLLDYADDMIYFGTLEVTLKAVRMDC